MSEEHVHHHHNHHHHPPHEESGLGFLIPEGLDSFNILFMSIIIVSSLIQIIYLLSPPKMKLWLENFDLEIPKTEEEAELRHKKGKFLSNTQYSTLFSFFFLLLTLMYWS